MEELSISKYYDLFHREAQITLRHADFDRHLFLLEQIMIADLKLTFPSGLATAVLINGFHTQGDKMAKYTSKFFFLIFKFRIKLI